MSTVMLTPSSCQPHHHQVAGKCNSSEACEFRGANILGRESLCCFFGKAAAVVGEVGSLLSTKSVQDCSESSICISKCFEVGNNVHQTVARARFHIKRLKNWGDRRSLKKSALLTVREDLVRRSCYMRLCKRLGQYPLSRLRAAKHEWCCGAPGKRDCSWRLLNAL